MALATVGSGREEKRSHAEAAETQRKKKGFLALQQKIFTLRVLCASAREAPLPLILLYADYCLLYSFFLADQGR